MKATIRSWACESESKISLGIVVLAIVVFTLPLHFVKAANTGLTIQPVKFSYTIKPGGSVSDVVSVTNAGDDDVVVYEDMQDFLPVKGTSGINFVGTAPGVTSVRDWVTVNSPESFTLKQGEGENINFTVSVPKDAEPGSHFGVLLFKAVGADQVKSGGLQVGTQVGALVLVTVPGNHLEKGHLVGFTTSSFVQSGPVDFNMSFENDGTVYFQPTGTITIKNIFGKIVALVPISGNVVLPTGAGYITSTWPVGFLLGPYSAVAQIYDGDGNLLATASTNFFALPIWYIVGFVVLFFVLYFFFKFLKNRLHVSISLKK